MADARQLLYQAKTAHIGIAVEVSDVAAAMQQFVLARKDLQDPELKCIQVRRAPNNPDSELWLVKVVKPTPGTIEDVVAELIHEAE